jgi:hypothetical protein
MIRRVFAALLAASLISAVASAQPRWKLTETLRIGGADSGPGNFVWAKGIDSDARGRIWVYEHREQQIRLFDADGKFLKLVARRGAGPGEISNAEGIGFGRDGFLYVHDAANARVSVFDAEGNYRRSWSARFCRSQGTWAPGFDSKGRIVDLDCVIGSGPPLATAVLAYHTNGSRVDTLEVLPECGVPPARGSNSWVTQINGGTRYTSIPFLPGRLTAVTFEGDYWCAPNTARYEISKVRIGSKDTLRVTRSLALLPVTQFERDSVIRGVEENGGRGAGLDYSRIPQTKPAIDRLTVDDRGQLWVRRAVPGGKLEFDIYDANAKLLAIAELPRPYRMSAFMPFVVRGDNLYTVIADDDDVAQVIRFKITR